MLIIIQVSSDVANSLHKRSRPTTDSKNLVKLLAELSVILEPMHPGTNDPDLATYFIVEADDKESADKLISRLQSCRAVKAVYVKPKDETPKTI